MYVAIHSTLTKWTSFGSYGEMEEIMEVLKVFRLCGTSEKNTSINPIYADSVLVSKTDLTTDIVPGHQTSSLCDFLHYSFFIKWLVTEMKMK